MDAVVPWVRLLALIAPHYPKGGPKDGRPPMSLEMMLPVYFLPSWYALSGPMAEETLYVSAEREVAFSKDGKVWGVWRYKRSPGSFASRLNCAKPPRAASSTPSTRRSTGSFPWCAPRSSIRSAFSRASSAISRPATVGWPETVRNSSRYSRSVTCSWFDGGKAQRSVI